MANVIRDIKVKVEGDGKANAVSFDLRAIDPTVIFSPTDVRSLTRDVTATANGSTVTLRSTQPFDVDELTHVTVRLMYQG